MTALLAVGAFTRCECEEPQMFKPGASYMPDQVLSFGNVAVTAEKIASIKVVSNGSAGLQITSTNFANAPAGIESKFIVKVKDDLLSALTPGRTSTISITYRPCPEAWNANNTIKPACESNGMPAGCYDFSKCPSSRDTADLVIVDNTSNGGPTIALSGQPVQAPVMSLSCTPSRQCNMPNAQLTSPCVSLGFGQVNAGETPCDLTLEIKNSLRQGKPTGALTVERLAIKVTEVQDPANTVRDGGEIGFSFLDESGQPLAFPIVVPIPEGQTSASKKVKVRYTGAERGNWRGEVGRMTGLQVTNDDPSQRPYATVSVTASGSAPDIQYYPDSIDFGPVQQGTTRTATVEVSNAGDAPLRITDVTFMTDTTGMKLTKRFSNNMTPPFEVPPFNNNSVRIFVSYTPRTSGADSDVMLIGSNDINDNPIMIPIKGGAIPTLRVTPPDQLVFSLPNPPPPPPAPPRTERLRVQNVGYGDLVIQRISIAGPGGDTMHSSVDDFTVDLPGCATLPCMPATNTLCPPTLPGCTRSELEIPIVYNNINDNSTTDLAELEIRTNDPADPVHKVVLSAEDNPCFYPTPIITVETQNPKVDQVITVNAMSSVPGGPPGQNTTITTYQWFWIFTPGAPPMFSTPDTVRTTFTAPRLADGAYVLGLHVTNSCGRMSQSEGSETILISP